MASQAQEIANLKQRVTALETANTALRVRVNILEDKVKVLESYHATPAVSLQVNLNDQMSMMD